MVAPPVRLFHRWNAHRRVRALGPVRTVLVMCTANRVRSPFAGEALAPLLPADTTVRSRGILEPGHPCPPEAIQMAEEFGVDLSGHVSARLTPPELVGSGVVLVMEQQMRASFIRKFPGVRDRIFLLGDFDPGSGEPRDLLDPYLHPLTEYRAAYARIRRCCEVLARLLHPRDDHLRSVM